jgi:hypothetical protein
VRHGLPFGAKAAEPRPLTSYPFSHDAQVGVVVWVWLGGPCQHHQLTLLGSICWVSQIFVQSARYLLSQPDIVGGC